MTITQKLILCFVVLIGVFCLNFFINQQLSRQVITNSSYLNHSEVLIRNSNLLHKNMIDMQNGFRGYLLTGQSSFLQPYTEGMQTIPILFEEQTQLVSGRMQQQRLDSIKLLHSRWLDYSQALMSAKRDTIPEAGFKYNELFEQKLKMEAGKKINDSIRHIFLAFDKYEYSVRQRRRDALRESIEQTRNISVALTIFSVFVAIVSCILIVKIIVARIGKMVGRANSIAGGDFSLVADNQHDEFKKLSESLDVMSETLNRNFTELIGKNKELDQFAYVVSHDLKAPLRGIEHITRWMEEDHHDEISPGLGEKIDLIKGRTKRLENMIDGLLNYARTGRVKSPVMQVDTRQLIEEQVMLLVPKSFAVIIDTAMPTFNTAKLPLEQVFANLISNAVKYNDKPQGEIHISCRNVGNHYVFSIADNGPGIPEEYHEKILLMFQTLRERDAFESTGIGLAIVKKILDEYSGSVKVSTRASGGTIFEFTWPKSLI